MALGCSKRLATALKCLNCEEAFDEAAVAIGRALEGLRSGTGLMSAMRRGFGAKHIAVLEAVGEQHVATGHRH